MSKLHLGNVVTARPHMKESPSPTKATACKWKTNIVKKARGERSLLQKTTGAMIKFHLHVMNEDKKSVLTTRVARFGLASHANRMQATAYAKAQVCAIQSLTL